MTGCWPHSDLPITALFSTLGRTAARGLECSWAAHKMREVFDDMMANLKTGDMATANMQKWEPDTWPADTKGVGFGEAPRGALGHWMHIQDTKLANYQAVVPTTWNASPRDRRGQYRRLRGSAARHADGEPRAAARDSAHDSQLRSLPGLRFSRHVSRWTGARDRQDSLRRNARHAWQCSKQRSARCQPASRFTSSRHRCGSGTGFTPCRSWCWRSPAT